MPLDLVFPTQTPEETDVETDSKINNQAVVLMEAKMLLSEGQIANTITDKADKQLMIMLPVVEVVLLK